MFVLKTASRICVKKVEPSLLVRFSFHRKDISLLFRAGLVEPRCLFAKAAAAVHAYELQSSSTPVSNWLLPTSLISPARQHTCIITTDLYQGRDMVGRGRFSGS